MYRLAPGDMPLLLTQQRDEASQATHHVEEPEGITEANVPHHQVDPVTSPKSSELRNNPPCPVMIRQQKSGQSCRRWRRRDVDVRRAVFPYIARHQDRRRRQNCTSTPTWGTRAPPKLWRRARANVNYGCVGLGGFPIYDHRWRERRHCPICRIN